MEADFLVVGAGLTGLGFTDALLAADPAATVVVVDRRDRPGGHWLDAYPFVRLHLPSAYYGVGPHPPGRGDRDPDGLAPRATGAEVLTHLAAALDRHVASGRVRFVGLHDHAERDGGTHVLVSRVTGRETPVDVRRAVVHAAHGQGEVPATHRPSFTVDDGATAVPVGGLVSLGAPGERYTVLGSGKTGMDACTWLLEQGVDGGRIRWVRPRDMWLLDRRGLQPDADVGSVIEGFSLDLEAVSLSATLPELFDRLEATGRLLRLDPAVEPTMYRCAITTAEEVAGLRTVSEVVRLGRVRRVAPDRVALDDGDVPSRPGEVVVDCTARGLGRAPARPVFTPGRITAQQVRPCSPSFNAALIGHVAATQPDLVEANAVCPVLPVPEVPLDWFRLLGGGLAVMDVWRRRPDVQAWVDASRFDIAHGVVEHLDEPRVREALARFATHVGPAVERLHSGYPPVQRGSGRRNAVPSA